MGQQRIDVERSFELARELVCMASNMPVKRYAKLQIPRAYRTMSQESGHDNSILCFEVSVDDTVRAMILM